MTHDELLKEIIYYPDTIIFGQYYRALRAVAELHADDYGMCMTCEMKDYPCPTIQAIEKGLM
jgi:hypothetical protein